MSRTMFASNPVFSEVLEHIPKGPVVCERLPTMVVSPPQIVWPPLLAYKNLLELCRGFRYIPL